MLSHRRDLIRFCFRNKVLDDLAILAFAIPLLLKEVDKFSLGKPGKNPNGIDAEIATKTRENLVFY